MEIKNNTTSQKIILVELELLLTKYLLYNFYPLTIDKDNGGFLCNHSYDWKFTDPQDKMIVTQARHTWTPARASQFYPDNTRFSATYFHGYNFLKDIMWDKKYGGFYTMRNPEGGISAYQGYYEEKRTYGNAFAIYALSGLYEVTGNKEILDFAIETYDWIEKHAFDSINNGYFQFLTREGNPFSKSEIENTKASDASEAPFKDQNSSIHLLEAYTELYKVWKDEGLKAKLHNLLVLIRDVITTEKGYMNLFFDDKWNPVSFREADDETRNKNYGLDHVSFGHDYETAFLMLEASHVLELEKDTRTLSVAKRMIDHAMDNGWDEQADGFYEAGYYYNDSDKCTIIRDTKNWWSQAEGLNSLLMMAKIFPEEKKYFDYFVKLFNYIKTNLIDFENGGWYEGGLDKEPHHKFGLKGHIWKACYHEARSLMNCIKYLSDENFHLYKTNEQFRKLKEDSDCFVKHWREIAIII